MKRYRQIRIAVVTLFAALAMAVGLVAQNDAAQAKNAQHHLSSWMTGTPRASMQTPCRF